MELEPRKKFRLLPTGAEFEEELTQVEWANVGIDLFNIHAMTPIWIGDWLNWGEGKWGEMYAQAVDITKLSVDTLAHYRSTMGRIPKENRREGLSFSHYREVAKLPVEEQKLVLDRIVQDKLSVRGLRSAMAGENKTIRLCDGCLEEKTLTSLRFCMGCAVKVGKEREL